MRSALVLEVRFLVWGEGRVGAAFHKVGARASDFALVACAAQAALDVEGRRIALTAAVGVATDVAGLGEALRGSRRRMAARCLIYTRSAGDRRRRPARRARHLQL
jgi:hypothetical protein